MVMYYFWSPIASNMIGKYGHRYGCIAGSIVACFALSCLCFVNNLILFGVIYCFLLTFGLSMINVAIHTIPDLYYTSNRGAIIGIISAGSSLGETLSYSLCTDVGTTILWKKVYIILSIMVLVCIPFSDSMNGIDMAKDNDKWNPISEYNSEKNKNEQNTAMKTTNNDDTRDKIKTRPYISTWKQSYTISLLKNPTFIFICMSNMIAFLGTHLLRHLLTNNMIQGW